MSPHPALLRLFVWALGASGCSSPPEPGPEVSLPPPEVPPVTLHGALSVRDGQLVDVHGEPVQLRGVSTQWLNWEQDYATSREALAWLRDDWRLQVLRVANGVEYATGYAKNRETRHAMVERIVDNAIALDVYVIVDWHTHQLRQAEAVAFFTAIAQRYGDHPHVLYELFNEPGPAADWSGDLLPYHDAVLSAIRSHDPDNVVILGSPEFSSRPDVAAAAPVAGGNLAYSMHFYACTHGAGVRARAQAALDAGVALFVTEWAATPFEGGTVLRWVCEAETRRWHAWMDRHQISWTAWKLSADLDLAGMLASGAPVEGGWTLRDLKGHGPLVRELVRGR